MLKEWLLRHPRFCRYAKAICAFALAAYVARRFGSFVTKRAHEHALSQHSLADGLPPIEYLAGVPAPLAAIAHIVDPTIQPILRPSVEVPFAGTIIEALDADHSEFVVNVAEGEADPDWVVRREIPRPSFTAIAAQGCKQVFGTPLDTPANRLCVRKWLRTFMEKCGHRPTHITRDLEIAIALVFVPSAIEIERDWFEGCTAVQTRKYQAAMASASLGRRKAQE